jgi:hypothetical protein
MLSAVTAINRQIIRLAPVLNSPSLKKSASVSSENEDVPVAVMTKRHGGAIYLFAVVMRKGETAAEFTVNDLVGEKSVEVLGENREIILENGVFKDKFEVWDVHLYRIQGSSAG